jgi:hypothetical protein
VTLHRWRGFRAQGVGEGDQANYLIINGDPHQGFARLLEGLGASERIGGKHHGGFVHLFLVADPDHPTLRYGAQSAAHQRLDFVHGRSRRAPNLAGERQYENNTFS